MQDYDNANDFTGGGSGSVGGWDPAAEGYRIKGAQAPQRTADDIEESGKPKQVPPGDHLLVVVGFSGPPRGDTYPVQYNGRKESYRADVVEVIFGLASDPRYTVRDKMYLPPDTPNELRYYSEGQVWSKRTENWVSNWMANRFYHFIAKLGWPFPAGGTLPEDALDLSRWKGRTIHATVEAGRPYQRRDAQGKPMFDESGNPVMRDGFNSIKFFSYRASDQTRAPRGDFNGRPEPQAALAGRGFDNL